MSELHGSKKSLETVRRMPELLPSFFRKREHKEGEPLAWATLGVPSEILYAFDIQTEWPENFGALCAAKQVSTKYIEIAEADGYSSDLCSYLLNNMGYAHRVEELGGAIPPEAPKGGMGGTPTMLLASGIYCDPRSKWLQSLSGRYMKEVPVFTCDSLVPPYDANLSNQDISKNYKKLNRKSLEELINFITQQTGRKIDIERLRHAVALTQEQSKLLWEIHELRVASPCPMGSEDFFSGCVVPLAYMTGEIEAINYLRCMRDEVQSRVERGIGVLQDECYRLLWVGLPPWFNLGFFNDLGELGAVFPAETLYFPGPAFEIDLSDPLEAMVDRLWKRAEWGASWGTVHAPECATINNLVIPGDNLIKQWIEKFHLDGAVMHRTRTCRATSWGQVHIKNLLAEIGIPSVIIESDMGDPRSWNQSSMMTQVRGLLSSVDSARRGR